MLLMDTVEMVCSSKLLAILDRPVVGDTDGYDGVSWFRQFSLSDRLTDEMHNTHIASVGQQPNI